MNCENGEVEIVIKNRSAGKCRPENPSEVFQYTAWVRVLEDGVFRGTYINEYGIEGQDSLWDRMSASTKFGVKRKVNRALRRNRRQRLSGDASTNVKTYRQCR